MDLFAAYKVSVNRFKLRKTSSEDTTYSNDVRFKAKVMDGPRLLGFFAYPWLARRYVDAAECGEVIACDDPFKKALKQMKAADRKADDSSKEDYDLNREFYEKRKACAKKQREQRDEMEVEWKNGPPEWLTKMVERLEKENENDISDSDSCDSLPGSGIWIIPCDNG